MLKYEYAGTLVADSLSGIEGMGLNAHVYSQQQPTSYCVPSTDCLAPASDAFCAMTYAPTNQSAAVAYQGNDYRAVTLGFPIEAVDDRATRQGLWAALLNFLLP